MTSIDQQIRSHINAFVLELHEMVRQAALASVTEAFGRPRIRSQNGTATQAAQPRGHAGVRGKGAKRDPNDLAASPLIAQTTTNPRSTSRLASGNSGRTCPTLTGEPKMIASDSWRIVDIART